MFKYRGIIEGFYGKPWSHVERLMLMKWMGDRGFTHYMYAPKADSYHRADWRKSYPEEEMIQFGELIKVAKTYGVEFGFAVSPGLSMRYSAEIDREVLFKKFAKFAEQGVTFFGLFFDDIPLELHHVEDADNYRSLAEAQVDVVNELYAKLEKLNKEIQLIFCPTIYCGNGKNDYLEDLGAGLNPQIQVFWTGQQVCSREITQDDIEPVSKALRRKPLIWDNYPVNDGTMAPEMHIGPYVGREGELIHVVDGFFLNPMNQIYASLIPLYACGQYLRNPLGYEADKAWEEGIRIEVGRELEDEFRHFAEYNQISPIHTPEMNRYYELWKFGDANNLELEAINMQEVAVALETGLQGKPLEEELGPWLKDFVFWSQVGLKAVQVQKQLRELFLLNPSEKHAIGQFIKLQINLNRLYRLLRKCPETQTAVTGGLIHEYALRVYRSVETLLRNYVDKRGRMMKNLRWILRKI